MKLVCRIACSIALAIVASSALGQTTYPDKPVRLVLGFAPGGGTDLLARLIAQKLTEYWKTSVVVENRPGAGGTIAAAYGAESAPDGYTLLLGSVNQNAIAPNFFAGLRYDVNKDFVPVAYAGYSPLVLNVNPSMPVRSVKELIDLAKAKPGQITAASAGGIGTTHHLAIEMFMASTGVKVVHVPYKGSSLSTNDLLAGQVNMAFDVLPPSIPYIQEGRLRALAVTTLKRSSRLPDVPTMDEAGVTDFQIVNWYGVFAPARTPPAIVAKINADVNRALHDPFVSKKLDEAGIEPGGGTPQEFATFVKEEISKFDKLVKARGIKATE